MIAAVVLAAGSASRFGAQKLLADLGGEPVVLWSVRQILSAGLSPVVVVLGREAAAVRAALAGLPVVAVDNPDYRSGLSSSIRAGVEALPPEVRAAAICLGDQPSVTVAILALLRDAFESAGKPIAAPVYRGERGNPVFFAASLFAELRALGGDQGARELLAARRSEIELVAIDRPAPRDVDTLEDLEILRRELARDGG